MGNSGSSGNKVVKPPPIRNTGRKHIQKIGPIPIPSEITGTAETAETVGTVGTAETAGTVETVGTISTPGPRVPNAFTDQQTPTIGVVSLLNFNSASSMTTWGQIKSYFNQQKELVDSQSTDPIIESTVSNMNHAIANYINRAGIWPNGGDDPDYNASLVAFEDLQTLQQNYIDLNTSLTAQITALTNNADLEAKLREVGQIKEDIAKLLKSLKNAENDASISKSRQESVENAQKNLSYYQGFSAKLGFAKPLHKISIPFLIGFGILLFFFSALLLKEFILTKNTSEAIYNSFRESFFNDYRFHAAIGGVVFTVVLVAILAASGRLGSVI